MVKPALNLIGGEWTGSPEFERRNPARPSEVVVEAPSSSAADLDAAITAAVAAQPAWAAMPAPSRGAILIHRGHPALAARPVARDLVAEEGKTLAEAKGEVGRASDVLRYFGAQGWRAGGDVLPSDMPGTLLYTRREPLGVVGLITPWNFPIAIPVWKIAPALVGGNTVVFKPAELTPLPRAHLAARCIEAGLPAGVVNVVHGAGRAVGDALARDQRVAGAVFTGSPTSGSGLARRS